MAIDKVLRGIPFLRQELTKIFMKKASNKSGIMQIPFKNKKLQLDIEDRVQKYIRDAQKQGVDLDMVSNENLKYTINLNENVDPLSRAISADSPEGRRITEMLLGKKGEVVDMTGKKIDTSQGIMGGKSVAELMKSGQVTKGAKGIKKSKKVENRELFEEANKRLNETNNFVTNTITKIKGMEPTVAMKEANSVIGRKGQYKNLTPEQSKKILQDTEDHIFQRDPDNLYNYDPEDMADGGVAGLLGERTGYNEGLTAKQIKRQDTENLAAKVKEFVDIQGSGSITGKEQIQGAPEGITSNKSFINLMANLDIPISEQISLLGDVYYNKFRDKIEKGDEELFIEDPASYINKKIGVGINQGNEGFSGSAKYDVDSGKPEIKILFKKSFAEGGPARQNFKMGKRAFLKFLASGAAGIAGLKSGLLGLGKGGAKKAVTETVKQSATSGTPPPYFFKLVEKIKMLGDDVTVGSSTMPRTKVTRYKDYELTESLDGSKQIQKIGKEDDMITQNEYMTYTKGQADETTKGKKVADDYEEVTETNSRIYKDNFNDPDYEDGINLKEILEEVGETVTKKADGGRIGFYEGGDYNRSKMKELADAFARQKYGRTLTDLPDVKRFEMEDLAIKSLSKDIEKKADGGRIGFDSGGSPLQRLRQSLVDDLMYKFPSMKEEDMQMIVKDINLGMSTEEAQASMSENFTKVFGSSGMFSTGGIARMLGE